MSVEVFLFKSFSHFNKRRKARIANFSEKFFQKLQTQLQAIQSTQNEFDEQSMVEHGGSGCWLDERTILMGGEDFEKRVPGDPDLFWKACKFDVVTKQTKTAFPIHSIDSINHLLYMKRLRLVVLLTSSYKIGLCRVDEELEKPTFVHNCGFLKQCDDLCINHRMAVWHRFIFYVTEDGFVRILNVTCPKEFKVEEIKLPDVKSAVEVAVHGDSLYILSNNSLRKSEMVKQVKGFREKALVKTKLDLEQNQTPNELVVTDNYIYIGAMEFLQAYKKKSLKKISSFLFEEKLVITHMIAAVTQSKFECLFMLHSANILKVYAVVKDQILERIGSFKGTAWFGSSTMRSFGLAYSKKYHRLYIMGEAKLCRSLVI